MFIIYLYADCTASKCMVQSSLQFQTDKKKHLLAVHIRGATIAVRRRKILELIFPSVKLFLLHSWVKLSLVVSLEISELADIFIFKHDTCFPFPLLNSPTEATEKKKSS